MGILIPESFPLSSLKNDAERAVVEALRDQLTDGWMILPDVGLSEGRERQMDVVIAHERDGIAVIEVKGHRPTIEGGIWMANGRPMQPQPLAQARDNSFALARRLESDVEGLRRPNVPYGVVFPHAARIDGQLPTGVEPGQVMLSSLLENAQAAIDRLMATRVQHRLPREAMQAIIDVLRPDADVIWDPEWRTRHARARIEQVCGQHVRLLERMDANRRVIVTGAAGTGKTRLALAWTRRALLRGERTLLTCYNDPLGDQIRSRFSADDDRLVVGPFLRIACTLEGMPAIADPREDDARFWEYDVVGHLHKYLPKVTQRFDTIVVDEAQDFSPSWIAQLTQLLDPDGPRRLLMVADEEQSLFDRGFRLPSFDDGWVRCELMYNCRNTAQIAKMLRQQFGGAPPPIGGPEVDGVVWRQAETVEEAIAYAGDEYDRLIELDDHDPRRLLVTTIDSTTRDRLREANGFVRWEARSERSVICESVRRAKGLEFDYVILVVPPGVDASDELLYTGCSRAVAGLTVIGPSAIGERLGLTATKDGRAVRQ